MPYIQKGTRIRYRMVRAKVVGLAGMQMKTEATINEGVGTVTHVYGDHPTEPKTITFTVQLDSGGNEIEVPSNAIVDLA